MKYWKILTIAMIASLAACSGTGGGNENVILPPSGGGLDEIMIISSKQIQEDTIGRYIDSYLEKPYPYLPQPERTFAASLVAWEDMNNLLKQFRNVIIVGHMQENSPTFEMIQTMLLNGMEREPQMPIVRKYDDIWARNQTVFYVIDQDEESLLKTLHNGLDEIAEELYEKDVVRYREIAMLNGRNNKLSEQIKKYHGFDMEIPGDYQMAKNEGNMIWLRKNEPEAIVNLVIDVYSLDSTPFGNSGILIRDQFGKHVESNIENDYMITDTTFGYQSQLMEIDGLEAWENRGLWAMQEEFLGGAFINYYIHDKANSRAIFLEGFVHAPGKKKKPYIRTLESLLRSFQLTE